VKNNSLARTRNIIIKKRVGRGMSVEETTATRRGVGPENQDSDTTTPTGGPSSFAVHIIRLWMIIIIIIINIVLQLPYPSGIIEPNLSAPPVFFSIQRTIYQLYTYNY